MSELPVGALGQRIFPEQFRSTLHERGFAEVPETVWGKEGETVRQLTEGTRFVLIEGEERKLRDDGTGTFKRRPIAYIYDPTMIEAEVFTTTGKNHEERNYDILKYQEYPLIYDLGDKAGDEKTILLKPLEKPIEESA